MKKFLMILVACATILLSSCAKNTAKEQKFDVFTDIKMGTSRDFIERQIRVYGCDLINPDIAADAETAQYNSERVGIVEYFYDDAWIVNFYFNDGKLTEISMGLLQETKTKNKEKKADEVYEKILKVLKQHEADGKIKFDFDKRETTEKDDEGRIVKEKQYMSGTDFINVTKVDRQVYISIYDGSNFLSE